MGVGFGVSYHYRVLILVSLDWIAGVGVWRADEFRFDQHNI